MAKTVTFQVEEDEKVFIDVECQDCHGSGVYHGFAEPDGVAVVCFKCGGSGKKRHTPFTGRRERNDIRFVQFGGKTWSYRDFLDGKIT